jgi:cyclic pyranopterin phosphate synthase
MTPNLTHFDEQGASRMVDVSGKSTTRREATASGRVHMSPVTLRRITDRTIDKGDVFEVARLAAIMAAKRTAELIPLCHSLALDCVSVAIAPVTDNSVEVRATCQIDAKTGVEMEALVAVSVACLTIYDMCKAIDRGMRIERIQLESKSGGRSGAFERSD